MSLIKIAGTYVNKAYIREVKLVDYNHAVVWVGEEREPRHCLPDEVGEVRDYVQEAMR